MPGLHVTTDPENPISVAICDGCAFSWNRDKLQFQWDYNGSGLYNTGFLHCPLCLDEPQAQFLNPELSADPLPIENPRPDFKNDTDDIETEAEVDIDTEADVDITTEN